MSIMKPIAAAGLILAATSPLAWADPPAGGFGQGASVYDQGNPEASYPPREREFIQIIDDARKEEKRNHSLKDVRMGMQIRVMNFYKKSPLLKDWLGTVQGTRVSPNGDVWINIRIADRIGLMTSPTHEDDPHYVTLLRGGSKLATIAADLKNGQPVRFTATLMRYVTDSDDDMINNPRVLASFTQIAPLQ